MADEPTEPTPPPTGPPGKSRAKKAQVRAAAPSANGEGHAAGNLPVPTIMAKQVVPRTVETEMRQSFLDYAMSVIVARALPDARDGLKPVHRRILYAMGELGMGPTSAYKKSARVVGEVLGKYHPHGDNSVYEAMVRMAQDWSLRYPLVDGQGNFGSVDGDAAAAMRYTEARLAKMTQQLLGDLDKETVDFGPNFDATLQEPLVLPSAIPNLLINGSAGIAVGMATNVAPHNLNEIVDATVRLIDHPETTNLELVDTVQGPDFPTGGIIHGRAGILSAIAMGKGKLMVRGKHEIESMGADRERIIFTEIPYQVNKSELIIHIAELVKDKVLEGISDLRDESDRRGMRMVIELKRDAITDVVLNQLWKHTALQSTFAINNLALVDGRPQTLGLRELLIVFLRHRFEVVTRRINFDLAKAEARAHLLEGLLIALASIDAVVALIRASKDPETALHGLIARYGLTEVQGKAILDMKLQRLTTLETVQVKDEHTQLVVQINEYRSILADATKVNAIIRAELVKAKAEFGDNRRTVIEEGDVDIDDESLIPEEESVYLFTNAGYLKRMPLGTWREQHRGGKGSRGMTTKEEDEVVETTVGSTHDWLCFFTNHGRLHWLKGHRVPTGSRAARGKPVVNLLQLEANELVETIIPVRDFDAAGAHFLFATKLGTTKRTALSAFKNVRAGGIIAISLEPGDELLAVRRTDGKQEVILATKQGQACRFDEAEVRAMGRDTTGVRGVTLEAGDEVVSLALAEPGTALVSVTANGYGKRTELDEYRKTHRGGKGVRTIIVNDRNGPVVAVRTIHGDESLLVITRNGMVSRIPAQQLRAQGRSTQGVTLMDVAGGDQVTQVAVLPADDGTGELAPATVADGLPS